MPAPWIRSKRGERRDGGSQDNAVTKLHTNEDVSHVLRKPSVFVHFGHEAPVGTQARDMRSGRFWLQKSERSPTMLFVQVRN